MFAWVKEKVEDVKAWRRGEVRVAPYGVRGRVYADRGDGADSATDNRAVDARGTAHLAIKIIRADGSVEVIEQVHAQILDYPNG